MKLAIDIVSDLVCPWCFIGQSRLATALARVREQYPQASFHVNWLPFFLNPGTPPEGEPYRAFMAAKFGSEARVQAMQQQVVDAGRESGVDFNFERIAIRANTRLAQRLIQRAQSREHGLPNVGKLVERLFVAYFQRGENIGDIRLLADIAGQCGDRREAVIADLESNDDSLAALTEQVKAWQVTGVPFFVFDKKLRVAGAQQADTLAAAIVQAMRPL